LRRTTRRGGKAAVLIVNGSGRETITLALSGDNSLKGDTKSAIVPNTPITLTIKASEGKSGPAKFKK
jgi:hypothetical protein